MDDEGDFPPVEKKQEDEVKSEQAQKIMIKVSDEHENAICFKVKMTTALSKVFDAYCSKNSLQRGDVRFYFNGARVSDTATPKSLDMSENDIIEVMRNQIGGC